MSRPSERADSWRRDPSSSRTTDMKGAAPLSEAADAAPVACDEARVTRSCHTAEQHLVAPQNACLDMAPSEWHVVQHTQITRRHLFLTYREVVARKFVVQTRNRKQWISKTPGDNWFRRFLQVHIARTSRARAPETAAIYVFQLGGYNINKRSKK